MALSRRQFVAGASALALGTAAAAMAGCSSSGTGTGAAFDAAYINGKIYTANPENKWAEAVGIKDGKFAFVGTTADLQKQLGNVEAVDLKGATVVPGFIDAHNHIYKSVLNEKYKINLESGKSAADYQKLIKEYVEKNPDTKIYRGHGWLNSGFENGTPTAALLDEVCPDKPAIITSSDGHSSWTNTKFMEAYEIDKDFPNIDGGTIERDSKGNPIGCFRDTASNKVAGLVEDYDVETYAECIKGAEQTAASFGYTGYLSAMMNEAPGTNYHDAFIELDKKGELIMRSRGAAIVGSSEARKERMATADGWLEGEESTLYKTICIKIFMDGVVEGKTALLKEPYSNDKDVKNYGSDSWANDPDGTVLQEVVKYYNDKGVFCHFHAVGDQAIENALSAIEAVQGGKGDVNDVRNSMTHLQIVDDDQFKRFADTGTIAVLNPWGNKSPGFFKETECVYLGEERANNEYPERSFADAGVKLAFGTDYPAGSPWNSFSGIEVLVNRTLDGDESTQLNTKQALTVEETIDMMTTGSAYALHLEEECGSITEGMSADMVVLSQDIFEVDPIELHATTASLTLCMGNVIYEASK